MYKKHRNVALNFLADLTENNQINVRVRLDAAKLILHHTKKSNFITSIQMLIYLLSLYPS